MTALIRNILEHMGKHILTHCTQQHILRLEMRVKGAAPNIRGINDILDRNVFISLACEKLLKCGQNCRTRLFSAPLHIIISPLRIPLDKHFARFVL